jgi:hypothetical protein
MAYSFRRKQMLNWCRNANPANWDDVNYRNWMRQVGEADIKSCIKKASEEQLDDLYILREELRLGI